MPLRKLSSGGDFFVGTRVVHALRDCGRAVFKEREAIGGCGAAVLKERESGGWGACGIEGAGEWRL